MPDSQLHLRAELNGISHEQICQSKFVIHRREMTMVVAKLFLETVVTDLSSLRRISEQDKVLPMMELRLLASDWNGKMRFIGSFPGDKSYYSTSKVDVRRRRRNGEVTNEERLEEVKEMLMLIQQCLWSDTNCGAKLEIEQTYKVNDGTDVISIKLCIPN